MNKLSFKIYVRNKHVAEKWQLIAVFISKRDAINYAIDKNDSLTSVKVMQEGKNIEVFK